jgi:hypothetical protein
MADQKISQLTAAATPLVGTEVFPIVQSGSTVKATIANVQAAPIAAETASRMLYLNASKVPTTSADATFDGTNLGLGASPTFYGGRLAVGGHVAVSAGNSIKLWNTGGTGLATLAGTGTNELSITAADGVKLVDGNLIQGTAAKGINFTANTPAAGMTSQLLNWYEEGTFTATYTGTGSAPTTPVTTTARYTRVGRLVTVHIGFANPFSTAGATGNVQVTGLPFTSGYTAICPVLLGDNLGTVAVGYLTSSSTTISLVNPGDLGTPIAVKNTIYSYMNITLSYTV